MKMPALAYPLALVLVVECVSGSAFPAGSGSSLREAVSAAAQAALLPWIESIPPDQLERFGFRSAEEAARASLLAPLPSYSPPRFDAEFSRSWIESKLDEPALSWLVPVAVEERIVGLIVVDTPPGDAPEVVELGKSFAANRLRTGIRQSAGVAWRDLRFLSFAGPNTDLLLSRQASGSWRWLNLEGTYEGTATELEDRRITELVESLRLSSDR